MMTYDEIFKISMERNAKNVARFISEIDKQIENAANDGRFSTGYYIDDDDYSAKYVKQHYRSAGYIVSRPPNRIFIQWGYTGISRWFWKLLGF